MTADRSPLAVAKADYEHQTEGLFDFDPPPLVRRGAAEYLLQLASVQFRDDTTGLPWTFWALAPPDRRWKAWAEHVARDRDRGWIAAIEHVWLTRAGILRQALVDVQARRTPRRRPAMTSRDHAPDPGAPFIGTYLDIADRAESRTA